MKRLFLALSAVGIMYCRPSVCEDVPTTGSTSDTPAQPDADPASAPKAQPADGQPSDPNKSLPPKPVVTDEMKAESEKNRASGDDQASKSNYPAAIRLYEKALELDPDNLLARMNCGAVRNMTNDAEGAIDDMTYVIEQRPNLWKAFFIRGSAYLKKGEASLAIADLDKSLSLKADQVDAFNYRAEAKILLEDYQGARDDFKQILKMAPNDWRAWAGVALMSHCLNNQPDFSLAAVRMRSSSPDTRLSANYLDERIASLDLIIKGKEFEKAEPKTGADFISRAHYRMKLEQYNDAIADAKKAMDLSRRTFSQEGHVIIAAAYHKLGNISEAVRMQRIAVSEIKKTDTDRRKAELQEKLDVYVNEMNSKKKKTMDNWEKPEAKK